ncbi:hypothetical protein EV195_105100 [Tenacibaculum skagerrakense]|uniref:Uncharacterized protein n=1 Tax=Tenacibaculum skagerrakense TaxID=186571 RepID=A0A4R2NRV2_9FLAO|nr:hypothetical protein [Tenacibaculum skagerrakense]TCP24669.1 hypothetical protein EV195_105100 [Tenacibaculum skagerrakense]
MQKILFKNTVKLIIAGLLIGFLHKYDLIIALLIFLKLIHTFHRNYKADTFSIMFLIGFIVTGAVGLFFEYIGTSYKYWEYHDISRQVPAWLFFAWGGAFITTYQIKMQIYKELPELSDNIKLYITLIIVALFPAFGEMIAINLGTWTYHLPYKVFGVPLIAIAALIIIHFTIHNILSFFTKKSGIKDIVFNP